MRTFKDTLVYHLKGLFCGLEALFLRPGTATAHVVTGKLTSADEHYQQEILDIEKVRKSINYVYDSTGRKSN